jgi:hypothetical protein
MAEMQPAPACPVFLRVQGIKGAVRKNSGKTAILLESRAISFPSNPKKLLGNFSE